MKVSILVPIYGVEHYIEQCARSLFEQSYSDIEYIFVNDCTPDSSMDILKQVLSIYPNRKSQVRIIEHEHNQGLGAARLTATKAATGEAVMHVDSDDYITPMAPSKKRVAVEYHLPSPLLPATPRFTSN